MKIKKSKLRRARIKLQAARENLDSLSRDFFLKEAAHEKLEKIGDWIVDVEGLIGRGRE